MKKLCASRTPLCLYCCHSFQSGQKSVAGQNHDPSKHESLFGHPFTVHFRRSGHRECLTGHIQIAQLLLARSDIDPLACDDFGNTPLHLAVKIAANEMVAVLLPFSDPTSKNNSGNDCLLLSFKSFFRHPGIQSKLLQSCSGDISSITDADGCSPVHYAVGNCDFTGMQLLRPFLTAESFLARSHRRGFTPLDMPSLSHRLLRVEMMKFLFETNLVDVKASPLILLNAIRFDNVEAVEYLLKKIGKGVNKILETSKCFNHQLAQELAARPSLRQLPPHGLAYGQIQSPLHYAMRLGKRKVLEALLDNHADPNIKNHLGETPLHSLFRYNCAKGKAVLKLFISKGADLLSLNKRDQLCYGVIPFREHYTIDEADAYLTCVTFVRCASQYLSMHAAIQPNDRVFPSLESLAWKSIIVHLAPVSHKLVFPSYIMKRLAPANICRVCGHIYFSPLPDITAEDSEISALDSLWLTPTPPGERQKNFQNVINNTLRRVCSYRCLGDYVNLGVLM
eukprot:NODE_210_length_1894_cov_105.985286_g186_i0.p1 GENE.NODE_210_length_1894_cov_105.985286_g186_i0~~NODE_210_length_1894_cov_105.985286_g186_i0.p1  ORF type:complete len:508 (-),score=50.37 NODE_210_length_1894_cov_105.985286_g186_i0:63-1586(-)